ncbi:hypothetical protein AHF37_00313 [Paragonimus kellicotti]|nr:hypothetical protein AHF37_00313 [Paragonimus kellicotti]
MTTVQQSDRYTEAELRFLLDEVRRYSNIVESPNNHSESKHRKALVWQHIATKMKQRINGSNPKSPTQLRNWWKRTKSRAKQRLSNEHTSTAKKIFIRNSSNNNVRNRGYLGKIFLDICSFRQQISQNYSPNKEEAEYEKFLDDRKRWVLDAEAKDSFDFIDVSEGKEQPNCEENNLHIWNDLETFTRQNTYSSTRDSHDQLSIMPPNGSSDNNHGQNPGVLQLCSLLPLLYNTPPTMEHIGETHDSHSFNLLANIEFLQKYSEIICPKPAELCSPAINLPASTNKKTDVETHSSIGNGFEDDVYLRCLQHFAETIRNDVQVPFSVAKIPEMSKSPEICNMKQELLKIEYSILTLKFQKLAVELKLARQINSIMTSQNEHTLQDIQSKVIPAC